MLYNIQAEAEQSETPFRPLNRYFISHQTSNDNDIQELIRR